MNNWYNCAECYCCIVQERWYCVEYFTPSTCYCIMYQIERSVADTEPATFNYSPRDACCYTFDHVGAFQGHAALTMFWICKYLCRKANWECNACYSSCSLVQIVTGIYTVLVSNPFITFHNGGTEKGFYLFERSIAPEQIQCCNIEQREISLNNPGCTTIVPGISSMAGGSATMVKYSQRIRRTRAGRIGYWRGLNERTQPSWAITGLTSRTGFAYSWRMQRQEGNNGGRMLVGRL